MNFRHRNPTPVQLGMSGEFVGKRYRVAGRLVMGMEYEGETYYWNEFNLVDDSGGCATLVFEQTERGGEWKLFTLIEPAPPITVAEAESKQVGDTFEFMGRQLRVSCVDESTVHHIEGEAPEGVEQGDVARYFNAESGNEMIVVSWTGNEIEFYRGLNLPTHAVMRAFGIQHVPRPQMQAWGNDSLPTGGGFTVNKHVIGVVIAIIVAVFLFNPFSCGKKETAVKTLKAAKPQLALGSTAQINAVRYRVAGIATVEVGQVGKRYLRHEYALVDDATNEVLLVQGTSDGADKWALLTPHELTPALRPHEAGAQWLGQILPLEERPLAVVTGHFLTRVQSVQGTVPVQAGAQLYGLNARSGEKLIVLRWNEADIAGYISQPVPSAVVKAFAAK